MRSSVVSSLSPIGMNFSNAGSRWLIQSWSALGCERRPLLRRFDAGDAGEAADDLQLLVAAEIVADVVVAKRRTAPSCVGFFTSNVMATGVRRAGAEDLSRLPARDCSPLRPLISAQVEDVDRS